MKSQEENHQSPRQALQSQEENLVYSCMQATAFKNYVDASVTPKT